MKKQIKILSLNKKTISNLNAAEMSKYIGGASGYSCGCHGSYEGCGNTVKGKTCPGHKTC